MKTIYIIDDQIETTEIIKKVLVKENFDAVSFNSAITALEAIKQNTPDLVLLDVQMPEMDGFEALKTIKNINESIKVIVITAYAGIEKSTLFLENGALDFIAKPFSLKDLRTIIAKVFSDGEATDVGMKNKRVNIVGESTQIVSCIDTAYKLSNTDVSILIKGENGTGKELLADFIHYNSLRRYNNFIKINCAAIPHELLESELFGYEKGAFTGASGNKTGKIEQADKGTLFLDEICELDKNLQSKLLRVLEYKCFERLGGNKIIEADFRLICATNKNILEEVKVGNFREDLYYRINTVTINIPPLRERKGDIELIANYYVSQYKKEYLTAVSSISDDAMIKLKAYAWPGNIRELKNLIHRLISLVPNNEIAASDLPENMTHACVEESIQGDLSSELNLENMEREYIIKALKMTEGNKKKSSGLLGISEKTLYNKIEKYKIEL